MLLRQSDRHSPGLARCAAALALFVASYGMARAMEKPSAGARLSARDRSDVSATACGPVGTGEAERIDARVSPGSLRAMDVSVQCRAHRIEQSLPVVRLVRCSSSSGMWKCADGRDAIQLELPNAAKVLIVPNGIGSRVAIDVATEASKLTVPPFHRSAQLYMSGECSVSQESGKAFSGATHYSVACSNGSLAVTRDCWSKGCRLFITGGTGKWD